MSAACQVHVILVSCLLLFFIMFDARSFLFCTFLHIVFVWVQDASEALFHRSAFKNVIFNDTEGVKKELQSLSLNKSLDPEGIISIKNQLSVQDRSVQSTNI